MIGAPTLRRRSDRVMESVLQMNKAPNLDAHPTLQTWQSEQESSEFDNGSSGSLLGIQVATARLTSSSSDSGPEGDLLPPELHNLESGGSLLTNDVSSANTTANFLLPKSSIWGTGDSEYSWAQDSLSQSSGTMDGSCLLSNDALASDTSRLLETSKAEDTLMSQWPLNFPSSAVSIHSPSQLPFQRRSWEVTSDDDHAHLGALIPNMNLQGYNQPFPMSAGFEPSKLNMDYLGERPSCTFEATSVYDSMARKIQNQMSSLDASSGGTTEMPPLSFPTIPISRNPGGIPESSDNTVSSGLFPQRGIFQPQKDFGISAKDHEKNFGTNNSRAFFDGNSSSNSSLETCCPVMHSTTVSNYTLCETMNSSKHLLESFSGNSILNVPPPDSILGPPNYVYSMQKVDPLESLKKWQSNVGTTMVSNGSKDNSGNTSGIDNLGRFSYAPNLGGDNEGESGLYDSTSWTTPVGQQTSSLNLPVVPFAEDSRKRFLHMSLGHLNNNSSHKRLHMETQNEQAAVLPASVKRSSSWASSLTSTCSKGLDSAIAGSTLPYTKSNSRHTVGPALNTNLKPRARQGSANDPQSIAARHRRERISERLKVLQDLVPNGSKVDLVTMLEKAINYVKFLQLQVKVLTTDDYWPSNEKGAAPCTALPNFEDMEGALKVLVAQAEKETNATNNSFGAKVLEKSPDSEDLASGSPASSDSM